VNECLRWPDYRGPTRVVAKAIGGRYVGAVTAIAQQLDEKLKTLDAKAASSLSGLVRNALDLVEAQNGTAGSGWLPAGFFTRIAQEFGPGPFERPPQGTSEKREGW